MFRNNLFLWLSLFSIIPLLLFFLYKRFPHTLYFPTTVLLEAARQKKPFMWNADLLLLLIRLITIFFIAVFFAGPDMRCSVEESYKSNLIVVDNSASMDGIYNNQTLFEYARDEAFRLAASRPNTRIITMLPFIGEDTAAYTRQGMLLSGLHPDRIRIWNRINEALSLHGAELLTIITDAKASMWGEAFLTDVPNIEMRQLPLVQADQIRITSIKHPAFFFSSAQCALDIVVESTKKDSGTVQVEIWVGTARVYEHSHGLIDGRAAVRAVFHSSPQTGLIPGRIRLSGKNAVTEVFFAADYKDVYRVYAGGTAGSHAHMVEALKALYGSRLRAGVEAEYDFFIAGSENLEALYRLRNAGIPGIIILDPAQYASIQLMEYFGLQNYYEIYNTSSTLELVAGPETYMDRSLRLRLDAGEECIRFKGVGAFGRVLFRDKNAYAYAIQTGSTFLAGFNPEQSDWPGMADFPLHLRAILEATHPPAIEDFRGFESVARAAVRYPEDSAGPYGIISVDGAEYVLNPPSVLHDKAADYSKANSGLNFVVVEDREGSRPVLPLVLLFCVLCLKFLELRARSV